MIQPVNQLLSTMKYAIFDLDGTVLDSMPIWRNLGNTVLHSLGIIPDDDLNKRFKTMTLTQSSQFLVDEYHLPMTAEELKQLFTDTVTEGYERQAELKPYAKEFLEILKRKKVTMCIATASETALAKPALLRNGVFSCFSFLLTCSEIQKSKETPDIYLEAMRRMGGNITNTVVFEDSYFSILAAKKAGLSVIALADDAAKAEAAQIQSVADYYCQSFRELLEQY